MMGSLTHSAETAAGRTEKIGGTPQQDRLWWSGYVPTFLILVQQNIWLCSQVEHGSHAQNGHLLFYWRDL